ncbi:MAG TPA: hypothetical protein VKD72_10710 [Gemmataceae bacterium]|nr:hypothetical protein [Gemmataceae bacterium]
MRLGIGAVFFFVLLLAAVTANQARADEPIPAPAPVPDPAVLPPPLPSAATPPGLGPGVIPAPLVGPNGHFVSPPNPVPWPAPADNVYPETRINAKTQRYVFEDPTAPPSRFRQALSHLYLKCWATHLEPTCGSLHSEWMFLFGSCRHFYTEPCLPGPPPLPLPPGVDPMLLRYRCPTCGF